MSTPPLTVLHTSDYQCGRPFLPDAADAMIRLADEVSPDVVVASGDLTQRAKRREFHQATALLDRFGDLPVVVTPGNHDVPLYRIWERLAAPYMNWRRSFGPSLNTVTRVDGATLVALNSSAPRRAIVNGRIDDDQIDFARRAFEQSPADDVRIAVIHHHFVPVDGGAGGRPLPRAALIAAELERMGVDVVLGGHVHQLHMGTSGDIAGGPVEGWLPFVACGTTTSWRGRGVEAGWNSLCVLVFDGGEIRVTPYRRRPDGSDFEAMEALSWPLRRSAHEVN